MGFGGWLLMTVTVALSFVVTAPRPGLRVVAVVIRLLVWAAFTALTIYNWRENARRRAEAEALRRSLLRMQGND
jgi:hypothetical protein